MSLINKHNEIIQKYKEKEIKINENQELIKKLENDKKKNLTISQILELDDRIYVLEQENQSLKSNDLNSYYLKIQNIICDYNNDTIIDKHDNVKVDNTWDKFICNKNLNKTKGKHYSKYLDTVSNNYKIVEDVQQETCALCSSTMYISNFEAITICCNCGYYENYLQMGTNTLTYEQEINTDIVVHFAYKRINHLKEILSQIQANENSVIPQEIIEKIKIELNKQRIYDKTQINNVKIKELLKKLKLNKYYEHSFQITNILNNLPPPRISNVLYENLINMFMEIQGPFEEVCPNKRKNFFSYNYILYKFCELLGENALLPLFPLLKSREKLYQQDCIWQQICKKQGWKFIKSV